MRKFLAIIGIVFVCFLIESVAERFLPRWLTPKLLLLVVIFFNMWRGIRYSLFVAFFAGLFQDSFSANLFGVHIFGYILAAYLTTFIKMYIYHAGSLGSRLLMVAIVDVLYVLTQHVIRSLFFPIEGMEMFRYILIPELIATLLFTQYTFKQLRLCASRLFA